MNLHTNTPNILSRESLDSSYRRENIFPLSFKPRKNSIHPTSSPGLSPLSNDSRDNSGDEVGLNRLHIEVNLSLCRLVKQRDQIKFFSKEYGILLIKRLNSNGL